MKIINKNLLLLNVFHFEAYKSSTTPLPMLPNPGAEMIDRFTQKPLFQSKCKKIDIIPNRIFGFAPNHNANGIFSFIAKIRVLCKKFTSPLCELGSGRTCENVPDNPWNKRGLNLLILKFRNFTVGFVISYIIIYVYNVCRFEIVLF